jgi:hypothetical protein
MTPINRKENVSSLKMNAKRRTKISDEDLHMAGSVSDVYVSLLLLKPKEAVKNRFLKQTYCKRIA